MMNKKLRKAVVAALGSVVLAGISAQASATGIGADLTSYINNPAGYTTAGTLPSYVWDGGNIGYGPSGVGDCTNNTCGVLPPGGQTRVGGSDGMTGSQQSDRLLGWNHTTQWYVLHVTTGGGYTVSYDRASGNTGNQPAFSIWSSGGSAWTNSIGSQHKFNQVATPSLGNSSAYLYNGGVTGFVGYANSGPGFTNGDGDTVLGALTFGTSVKDPADLTSPYNSLVTKGSYVNPHAGSISAPYAGVNSSVNTSDASVTGHADIQLWLPAGWYVLTGGGSCADFTCSPTAANSAFYNIKILSNAGVTAPVPVPAAVWLFGSALAGMGVIGRRKDKAAA
ncbi:VPLPA-CTERM sorting domain-containing protein [Methylomagnum sp.]